MIIKHLCKICKKEFLDYRSNYRKFCSKKCSYIDKSIEMLNNHPRYWLGKHRSEETKEKISKNNGGFKMGNLNISWKGGKTKLRIRIYGHKKYKDWRKRIFIRDNYKCRHCNKKSGFGKSVYFEVHHIIPFYKLLDDARTLFPKTKDFHACIKYKPLWDTNNGILLCRECHNKTKEGRRKDYKNEKK